MDERSSSRIAVIPARGGSKRIPKKNIMDFLGKPMLAYPIQAAVQSGLFDTVHVSTDDPEIRRIAQELGADTSFHRPSELADDVTPLLPVVRWVVHQFESAGRHFDDIFILFPCSPLMESKDLIDAYSLYKEHSRQRNLLTVCRAPAYVEWYYRRKKNGQLTPISPGGSFVRSQELEPVFYETGTFTIFSREWLMGATSLADDSNYIGYELPAWRAVDIDLPEDVEFAKALFSYAKSLR
jgi:N-acylneuraminate cytidylyltransferase